MSTNGFIIRKIIKNKLRNIYNFKKIFIILNTVILLLEIFLNQITQHMEEIILMEHCIKHSTNIIEELKKKFRSKIKEW